MDIKFTDTKIFSTFATFLEQDYTVAMAIALAELELVEDDTVGQRLAKALCSHGGRALPGVRYQFDEDGSELTYDGISHNATKGPVHPIGMTRD